MTGDGAPPTDRVEQQIRRIGRSAQRTNRARSLKLAEAVRLAADGRLSDAQRRAAGVVAHQVRGSAGTFGWARASALAAGLEAFFTAGADRDPTRVSAALGGAERLVAEFDEAPEGAGAQRSE